MTGSADRAPEPISFPIPDASGGPTKAVDAYWYGWRLADARASSLQAERNLLQDEIRSIDKKREALAERVCSLEDQNRLRAIISTVLQTFTGIVGGIVVYLATSNPVNHELTWVMAVLTVLLLIAGAGVQWMPVGRHREPPNP